MWHADEIEWMWDLFPGKYAKCRVFALLYGLTKNANGWKGSNARLAKVTRMSTEGVRKILDELAEEQLIAQNGEHIRTTYEPDNSVAETSNSVAPMTNSVATDDNPVADTDNSVASLPPTPPNTINEMEMEKFETFLAAFEKRGGIYTEWQKNSAKRIWSVTGAERRKAIMMEIAKPDGFWKSRPDWYLQDFVEAPPTPPKDYKRTSEFLTLVKTVPMVSAKYGDSNGIFTLEDALKHHLDVNYGMNFDWEVYKETGVIKWRERD